jgi:EAL domain-containing protein (putative c-di-GMP-specific phosphodiesterase class I)
VLIADALSLKVTAEGVEHEEEAMVLRAAGVDQFQGYLFYRPMTAEAVTALFNDASADLRAPLIAGAA